VPALSAAGAAVATPAIEEAQQQLEELQQQLADAQRQRDLRLRQARQDVALLPKGERKARLMLLEAAELTGLPVEKLAAMEPPQVQAVARKARKAAKKQSRAATAKLRKLARVAGGGAAGAVLDKLFAAAASGKDPVWRQACAALSGKERKALAAAGVDLESYRRQIAERAAGGTAASSEEDSDGDGDEQGEEEAVEEAAAAAAAAGSAQQQQQQDEAATEAAVAAHGGHFLRSCDASSPASASAAAAGQQEQDPLWFWERSQRQQRGAADPAASPQQQQQRVPGSLSGGGSSRLSPLHYEVEAFAARATPTVAEANAVQQAVLAIDAAARSLWPHSRTALFGSQVRCRLRCLGASKLLLLLGRFSPSLCLLLPDLQYPSNHLSHHPSIAAWLACSAAGHGAGAAGQRPRHCCAGGGRHPGASWHRLHQGAAQAAVGAAGGFAG
jgi:hypothetical protein